MVLALLWTNKAYSQSITVRQSISAEARYDNNAFLREDAQATDEDIVILISPDFNVLREGKKIRINSSYRLSGVYYTRNPEINTLSHYANIGAGYTKSARTSFDLNDAFSYTKESLEAGVTGIQTNRVSIWSNTVTLSANYMFTPLTSANLAVSDSIWVFDDPSGVDSRIHTASLSGTHILTALTSVTGTYSYSNFKLDAPEDISHIQTHSLQLSVTKEFRNDWRANLSGGVVYSPDTGDSYDWSASAGLLKNFRKSSLNLGYSRRLTDSAGLSDEINISEGYSIRWNRTLSETTDISLLGSYTHNQTKEVSDVDLNSTTAGLTINKDLTDWISLSVGYNYFRQRSDGIVGGDIDREFIFINISATTFERRF